VVFLALFVFVQKSMAATLTVLPASGNYIVGDTFSVQALLNTQSVATDGVDLHYLRFNNALLKLNSVTLGTLYTTTMTNAIDNNSGIYNFSQVVAGGAHYTGSGTLLTLNFQAVAAGIAAVSFDYATGATTDCNVSSSGSDVLSQVTGASFTIVANQLPIATASANPVSGLAPLAVQFTGSGTDPDGTIISYSWNFGDGSAVSSAQSPSHIFTSVSTYQVFLTVKDDKDAVGSKAVSITVTAPVVINVNPGGGGGGGNAGGGGGATTTSMTDAQLLAEIARLTALIAQLQTQILAMSGGSTGVINGIPKGFIFSTKLKLGTIRTDVKYLQIILNSDPATQVAISGNGSLGKETAYFGNLTKRAVIKFQEKYKSEILTPIGLTKGTGTVANKTIQKLNQILLKK